ncbi:MAG: TOBE domain-containing protein [Dechloromonas sp.]|nr:TOBE domain-containing protein [Dechloromonas sp.]
MKSLLAICLLIAAPLVGAGEKSVPVSADPTALKGTVLEVKEVESYTYLRLKTASGEVWAAITKAAVKTGDDVTLGKVSVMTNFESKSLKKTFPTIYFGSLSGAGSAMPAGHPAPATEAAAPADVRVAKATGANARSVAEIVGQGAKLKDKPVVVRGKVVKYNPGIMGKNWIHLRDGSGSEAGNDNDILITTLHEARLGDVVTVKGTVRANRDFGGGYAYKVLVEDATLQK